MEGHVTQSSISIQSEPPKTQMLGHEVVYSNNNNNINVKVEDSVIASEQVMKRKRGRPRKYDVKGSVLSPTTFSTHAIGTSPKRGRGRPPTLEDNNIIASTLSGFSLAETAGTSFKPYVMTVNTGEDVVSKILAFSQNDVSMAAVSILSATGVVSSALIRNSQASTHTYRREGWFEILSLSGSYIFVADGDAHCKKGLLSILLAGPDGSVYGGILQGSLIAAGPIQLVMASFKQNMSKEIMRKHSNGSSSSAVAVAAPNLERVPQKVPALINNSSIPTQSVIPTTTTIGVSENVIHANQNIQSASVNGVGLNSSIKE